MKAQTILDTIDGAWGICACGRRYGGAAAGSYRPADATWLQSQFYCKRVKRLNGI